MKQIGVLDLRKYFKDIDLHGQTAPDQMHVSHEVFDYLSRWLSTAGDSWADGIEIRQRGGLYNVVINPMLPFINRFGQQVDVLITPQLAGSLSLMPKIYTDPVDLLKSMSYGNPDYLFEKPSKP